VLVGGRGGGGGGWREGDVRIGLSCCGLVEEEVVLFGGGGWCCGAVDVVATGRRSCDEVRRCEAMCGMRLLSAW